tara:strand:- start:5168 stop:6817 length:1650 start_codon:yes stop_codon:yes gene_type:complete
MALPYVVAQVGYGLIRQILVGVNRKAAAARIAQELKVNAATGKKIADQFYKVQAGGRTSSTVGRGKNAQTLTSDAKKIQVATTESNAAKMGGYVNTPRGEQVYKQSLKFAKPNTTPASATNQGFFANMNNMGRTGAGFLTSPTGIGIGTAGLLGIGAFDAMNTDDARPVDTAGTISDDAQLVTTQNPDGSTTTSLMSTAGGGNSYRDQVRKGEIKLGITEKSYKDFKTQLNNYRRESGTSRSDLGERFFDENLGFSYDENDPRGNPEFAEEADLYRLEQDKEGIEIAKRGESPDFKYNPGNAGKFDIAFQAVKDAEKQATTPDAPSFSLADARAAIATGGAGLDDDTPTPRFGDATGPNQFELVKGDDRNLLERTFGIGDEGIYVRKVYDIDSGTYLTPSPGDTGYQEFTESELASGMTTNQGYQASNALVDPNLVNVGQNITNAKGEVIGTQGPITSTTVTPDITAQVAGPNGQMLLKDQTSMAGNISDQAQIFGLVNYLNNLAQNNNTFMGQNPGFNTGFFARPPMQQFYGTRQPGFFDREFYKGFF